MLIHFLIIVFDALIGYSGLLEEDHKPTLFSTMVLISYDFFIMIISDPDSEFTNSFIVKLVIYFLKDQDFLVNEVWPVVKWFLDALKSILNLLFIVVAYLYNSLKFFYESNTFNFPDFPFVYSI